MNNSVTLFIRNQTNKADKSYTLPVSTRIFDLKTQIQNDFEGHPPPELQTLIFAGKILQNGTALADILFDQTPQTFHLIVRQASRPRFSSPSIQPFTNDTREIPLSPAQPPPQQPQPQQQRFQQPLQQNPIPPQQGAQPGQQGNEAEPAFHVEINLSLILRLAGMLMLLSMGAKPERLMSLFVVAVFIYLFQTGLVQFRLLRKIANLFGQRRPPLISTENQSEQSRPAAEKGVMREVFEFIAAFFLSLYPSWSIDDVRLHIQPH